MRQSKDSNRIDEELVSVDALVHHLKRHCGCSNVQVEREDDDPPDFWIDVDGQTYAVEVTSIVTEQAYDAPCRALAKAIADTARDQGVLKGTYGLIVTRRPGLPRRNSMGWSALVGNATSFIQATRSAESTEESFLVDDEHGRVGIRKFGPTGASVGRVHFTEVKWQGDTRQEVQHLMQQALTTKRAKLAKKGVPSQCSRIVLVFYDAYGFADQDDARHSLLQTTGHDWFHSVFWAASFTSRANELSPGSPGRGGIFLYSKSAGWRLNGS